MVDVKVKAETKVFWKSKTFWVNIAGIIGGGILMIQGELLAGTPLTAGSIINIFLRLMTKQGVALKQ